MTAIWSVRSLAATSSRRCNSSSLIAGLGLPVHSGSRSRSRASGPKRLAHHWPGGPPPGHFSEPGAVVHGLRAEEHEIRVASLVLVHRIGLHEAGAARPCVVHGCPEHPL